MKVTARIIDKETGEVEVMEVDLTPEQIKELEDAGAVVYIPAKDRSN